MVMEAQTQERRGQTIKVPVASALDGKPLNIIGDVVCLVKGFKNPHKRVFICFNSRNRSERIRMTPGIPIMGRPFTQAYLWTDEGSSVTNAYIELEYGTGIYPSALGSLNNPIAIQRPRANISTSGKVALSSGSLTSTVSNDDPMRDYHTMYLTVHGPGRVFVSFFGPSVRSGDGAATGILLSPAPQGPPIVVPVEGSTIGFALCDEDEPCDLYYQLIGVEDDEGYAI